MKHLFHYKEFLNEGRHKKEDTVEKNYTDSELVLKEVNLIIKDMFDKPKKITYTNNDKGMPKSVTFKINGYDGAVEYDKIESEYTIGVLRKKKYIVSIKNTETEEEQVKRLKDCKKLEDKSKPAFDMVFKVVFKENDKFGADTEKGLDELTSRQLLNRLEKEDTSKADKKKIMDILDERDVDYEDPDEKDDEDEPDDEDTGFEDDDEKAYKK